MYACEKGLRKETLEMVLSTNLCILVELRKCNVQVGTNMRESTCSTLRIPTAVSGR